MRGHTLGRMTTQAHDDGDGIPVDTLEIRLAIARAHAGGISAKEAALRVGVAGQTWRNWEDGTSPGASKPAMLRYIADQLGVNFEWLRDGGPLTKASGPNRPDPTRTSEPYADSRARGYPLRLVA